MPEQSLFNIIQQQQVGDDLYLMKFLSPAIAGEAKPGQFVHIRAGGFQDPLLRRPISLFDADQAKGEITLFYRTVGRGTQFMASLAQGDQVDVMGPMGKGFTVRKHQKKTVLIGGGIGAAPLFYLARKLIDEGCQVEFWYGCNTAGQIGIRKEIESLPMVFRPCTMDGSLGQKGLVTELFKTILPDEIGAIYTCGPEIMMAAVGEFAGKHHIWTEVSLEEHMACGVGACLGCARKLKKGDPGMAKICKDGPVFNLNAVELGGEEI